MNAFYQGRFNIVMVRKAVFNVTSEFNIENRPFVKVWCCFGKVVDKLCQHHLIGLRAKLLDDFAVSFQIIEQVHRNVHSLVQPLLFLGCFELESL